ncbi:hypothetical protein [Siccibacter colletis]|uniref:hypothetical protein n=1 Tax=Siccibacter colletis TaxID=1505757 RepID=UPI0004E0EB24
MTSWKRKIQPRVLISLSVLMSALLPPTFSARADDMINEKYLFSFKTNKSTCILRVNDFPAADSTTADFGTLSAGFNLTAFLENGPNQIELLMGPQDHADPDTLFPDSSCQVTISKDTKDESVTLAEFRLTVDAQGNITAQESADYQGGAYHSKVLEGTTKNPKDFGLYKLESTVTAKGLPRWAWSDATPVSEKDLPLIKKAYADIWNMMKARDIEAVKKVTRISSEEMAWAEGTTPGVVLLSTDFPEHVVDKQYAPVPIAWDNYELKTYRGGRLFRLAAGFFQNSPLQFQNADGDVVFVYNPYFSLINGKVVLVR